MSLRWWALLLLLAWLCCNAAHERWCRRRQLRLLQSRCSEPACAASICVLMRCYHDDEAATTVRQLLEQAYCPFRVYIGVVEEQGSNVVGRLVLPHSTLVDHVHSCQTDFTTRWEVEAWQLYRGETHVLLLHSDTLLDQHWDRQLLALGHGVWSALPSPRHHKYPHLHKTRAAGGKIGQGHEKPGFSRLPRLSGPWSAPVWVTQPAVLRQSTPSLLWTSRFGFGPAAALEQAIGQLRGLPCTDETLDDALLAGALLGSTTSLRTPDRQLAWTVGVHRTPPAQTFTPGATQIALAAAYAAYSGINLATGSLTPAAQLGLSSEAAQSEVLCKYGSLARYQAEQRKNVPHEERRRHHGSRSDRAPRAHRARVSHLRVPRHSQAPVSAAAVAR